MEFTPLEYEQIKDLDYWHHIAGQVFYLGRYYDRITAPFKSTILVEVDYKELCNNPKSVINNIRHISLSQYDCDISIRNDTPNSFPFRQYDREEHIKNKFKDLISEFEIQSK